MFTDVVTLKYKTWLRLRELYISHLLTLVSLWQEEAPLLQWIPLYFFSLYSSLLLEPKTSLAKLKVFNMSLLDTTHHQPPHKVPWRDGWSYYFNRNVSFNQMTPMQSTISENWLLSFSFWIYSSKTLIYF